MGNRISIGSYSAYQYVYDLRNDFDFEIVFDKLGNNLIIPIDGQNDVQVYLGVKERKECITILNKASEWSIKAREADLSVEKDIAKIYADICFNDLTGIKFRRKNMITFKFYNNKDDPEGSNIMIICSYNLEYGTQVSVLFIKQVEFENLKTLLSEEHLNSCFKKNIEDERLINDIFK